MDMAMPDSLRAYLQRLPVDPEERERLRERIEAGDPALTPLAGPHSELRGGAYLPDDLPVDSLVARLSLSHKLAHEDFNRATGRDNNGRERAIPAYHRLMRTMPPIVRTSMAPRLWPFGPSRAANKPGATPKSDDIAPPAGPWAHWKRAALFRRILFMLLIVLQDGAATWSMAKVMPYQGYGRLEAPALILFAVLFGWVCTGFWTAMAGFLTLTVLKDKYNLSKLVDTSKAIPVEARTAIVMPICNENVGRVFAGIRATWESLQRTGQASHFDFFILSDSNDPELRPAETAAWLDLCKQTEGFGRIFYRWRKHRLRRKSGNIADFCRRWGANYRYMVVMDADSVMTGDCLTGLVRRMEACPDAGIIQTQPRCVGRDTLHARIQQFANAAYGPMFAAGVHFWQLGEALYWGHNAIIRVDPFVRLCALGKLPNDEEVLSHDFVEAALMRRAGWGVWIAYDLEGSYEEVPTNLIEELQRDARWCHGNMLNARFVLARGLQSSQRGVFVSGVMSYFSAPLWFCFLVISTALLAVNILVVPDYFSEPNQLFPAWPQFKPTEAIALFTATASLLYVPKILSLVLIGLRREGKRFGGMFTLFGNMLEEIVFSMLFAPVRMLFHSRFVLAAVMGQKIRWKSPAREDADLTWGQAAGRFGLPTALGLVWGVGVYWLSHAYFWWMFPILIALVLSIPLAVFTSGAHVGKRLRKAGHFVIPEETRPPIETARTAYYTRKAGEGPGFVDAVADPIVNASVCAAGSLRRKSSAIVRHHRDKRIKRALKVGPSALSQEEKNHLLSDTAGLAELHYAVWSARDAHPEWLAG